MEHLWLRLALCTVQVILLELWVLGQAVDFTLLACFIFPVMPFFAGSFKGILVDKLSDLLKEVQRESPSLN